MSYSELSESVDRLNDTNQELVAAVLGYQNDTRLANYTALRNYKGNAARVEITQSGISGVYQSLGIVPGYTDRGGDYVIGYNNKVWARVVQGDVYASWFGTPAAANMQAIFDLAAGKTVHFDGSKTYPLTSFTIRANTKVFTYGAKFRREAAQLAFGVVVNSCVSIDHLLTSSPGGITGDKIVHLAGDLITIGTLEGIADAEASFTSTNWFVEARSPNADVQLKGLRIDKIKTKNYRTAFFATYVDDVVVSMFDVETYRLAVYVKDITNSRLQGANIRGKSLTLTGVPGENGLLVESTRARYSTRNLKISNWRVEDSGEHAYRLGGNLSMSDIYFEDCVAIRPGQAWTVGYPLATEWHGGCGFKVLGGTAVAGQRHKNIYFTRCNAYDCSMNFGTFPAGHGVNNFTSFLLSCVDNVHLTDCGADALGQQYSARNTMLISACDGVYLNNTTLLKAQLVAINPYEETTLVSQGWAGLAFGVNELHINGGVYEVTTTTANSGIPFNATGVAYANKNWTMGGGVSLRGGSRAIYALSPTTGSYTGVEFDFSYSGSNADDATHNTPVVDGAAIGLLTARAPWRPAAYSPSSLNGSIWRDTLGGNFRRKASNSWATL